MTLSSSAIYICISATACYSVFVAWEGKMSLSICSECQTVEGGWSEPSEKEREEYGIDAESNETEDLVCNECGSIGSYRGIPDHDSCDLER